MMAEIDKNQTLIDIAAYEEKYLQDEGNANVLEVVVPDVVEVQAGGDHLEAMAVLEQRVDYKTPIRNFRKKYHGSDCRKPRPAPPIHNCSLRKTFHPLLVRTPINRFPLRPVRESPLTPIGLKFSPGGSLQRTPYPKVSVLRRRQQALTTCLRRSAILQLKRSQSLIDLSPNIMDMRDELMDDLAEPLERAPSSVQSTSTMGTLSTDASADALSCVTTANVETVQSMAARRITSWFLLKAYRRERQETRALRRTVGDLTAAGDHLQMQVVVLKDLIEAERDRLDTATQEATHCRMTAEAAVKDNAALEKDNQSLKERVRALDQRCESQLIAWHNLNNELQGCREQQAASEAQLKRERDKVAKLREDKRTLQDKVKSVEDAASAKETEQQGKIVQIRDQLARKTEECELRVCELSGSLNRQCCQITQLTADLEAATRIPPKPVRDWTRRMARLLSGAPLLAMHALAAQMLPALPPPGIIGL